MINHKALLPLLMALALASSVAFTSGCRTEGETFIADATLIGNATEGYGPYEVQVHTRGLREIRAARLLWRTEDIDAPVSVQLQPLEGGEGSFVGHIEAPTRTDSEGRQTREPFALGTRVDYWIEVEAEDSDLTRAPFEAPDETFFFVVGPPNQPVSIDGVSPPTGPSAGGTEVFVHGDGLRPDSQIIFGASVASEVRYRTSHLLEVVTPPGADGFVDVTVRNPGGRAGRLEDGFYYIPAPELEELRPDSGPTAGGTPVIIVGEGFEPQATVTFDGIEALATVRDRGAIVAISPPHPAGFVDVAVQNPDGQTGVAAQAFEYIPPPEVEEVVPPAGPEEGGQRATVVGSGFREGLTVFFDDLQATALNVTGDRIEVLTPPHAPGTVDVTIFNPDGQMGVGQLVYTYLAPPRLIRVQPDEGVTLGGETVTLIGTGFFDGMTATFDGLLCTNLVVIDSRQATCTTPAHPEGLVDVAIDVLGQTDDLPDGFLYVPPAPEIVDISPSRGSDLGGTRVEITVDFLQDNPTVLIDGQPVQVVDVDLAAGVVTVITAPHPEGPVDVTVVNGDGQSAVAEDGYVFVGPPIIEAIDPDRGGEQGGTEVTITGRNFVEGMVVTIDGRPAEVVSIDPESGVVVVLTPPRPLPEGVRELPVDVQVTNPDERFDIAEDGYTYTVPPPIIESLEPPRGPTWGGNEVRILGRNFQEGAVVLVNGVAVEATFVGPGELRITMIPGEGEATVEVINPDDQSDDAAYTYVVPEVSPEGGLTGGFTNVVIEGVGFEDGMQVTFDGVPAVEVTVVDARTIRAITPPNAVGDASLGLTLQDGRGDTYPDQFTYRVLTDVTAIAGLPEGNGCIEGDAVDIDGNGLVDFSLANGGLFQDDTRFVTNAYYLNQGGLTFRRVEYGMAENSMNVDFDDLDGDGDQDMFIVNLDSDNRLYENVGDGTFNDRTGALPFSRDSYDGGFINANGDGRPDIVFINTAEPENLFINQGGFSFVDRTDNLPAVFSEHDHDYSTGDINGDGVDDFVVVVDNSIESNGSLRYDADHRIFMSNGDGTYDAIVEDWPLGVLNNDVLEAQIADVNGDGLDDVIAVDNIDLSAPPIVPTTMFERFSVMILINTGGGNLELRQDLVDLDRLAPSFSFGIADMDQDGDLDLAVANFAISGDLSPVGSQGQQNWLFVNRGDGRFEDASQSWPGDTDVTSDIILADFDGDALNDVVLCNYLTPNRMLVQTSTP